MSSRNLLHRIDISSWEQGTQSYEVIWLAAIVQHFVGLSVLLYVIIILVHDNTLKNNVLYWKVFIYLDFDPSPLNR